MAKVFRNQLAVPLGLLLAFIAAVGVWFIPLSPERRAGSASTTGQATWQQRLASSAESTQARTERPSSANWNRPQPTGLPEFASTLTRLREPPPELPTIVEDTDDPDTEPEDVFVAPVITLDWEYQGSIASNNTRAAMLYIDGRQRFLFEGESIANPDDPSGDRVRIVAVKPMVVIAETQGVEVRLPLTSLTSEQRAAVLADGAGATMPQGPRTIPAPRPASADDIRRQRAAADRAQPNRAQPGRPQPNNASPTRVIPPRTPATRDNNTGKATPQQPTRTPARPQPPTRDQPQRREN